MYLGCGVFFLLFSRINFIKLNFARHLITLVLGISKLLFCRKSQTLKSDYSRNIRFRKINKKKSFEILWPRAIKCRNRIFRKKVPPQYVYFYTNFLLFQETGELDDLKNKWWKPQSETCLPVHTGSPVKYVWVFLVSCEKWIVQCTLLYT